MIRYLLTSALALTLSSALFATDWPQFRGPNATGVSVDKNLPTEWTKDKGFKWKATLPARGVSSPVVVGDRVYVTCASGTRGDRLHVLCFDAESGKQLWHRQLQATGSTACHPKSGMAANTPVADETGVYALFGTGDLAAFDKDGTLRWYRSLVSDYPTITNAVGMAASPVLVAGKLIVPMDNSGESFLAAVDTKYGKNIWKTERPREINWTTPIVRQVGSTTELLFAGPKGLTAYDATSGADRWTFKGGGGAIPIGVVDGDALYLPVAGVSKFKIDAKGVAEKPEWNAKDMQTGYPSPVVYDGRVFTVGSQGLAVCTNAKTGKVIYKERLKGAYSASPVAGDGKVYFLNETGLCTVVSAKADEYEPLATNDLGDGSLGTPAIANGRIYIRTDKALYAIGK
ncbi:Polyvinylalcohol dehydrogenase precursor [Gemmata sp. SH-PL17]|uniref:outer membrane protein assembly factor BamB family protein n=1 Tax=Gemmata sp. SH-PL17 TaxID=1630693 RepID=UPI00078CC87D|nr:PQQ-binding-like beta-propeller repeat protein [Gemmata sp. SH-PL17]AMV29634.1 Polyvinylalcohol dehydrogenase precursor [Gemmata sp. SH-PL17]